MMHSRVLVLLAVICGHVEVASRSTANPVSKVLELLAQLTVKVQEDGAAEAAAYDKYACFCKSEASNKDHWITKSDEKIKVMEADEAALFGEIEVLNGEATAAGTAVTEKTTERTQKNTECQNAQAAHDLEAKDLEQAIDAIKAAMAELRSTSGNVASVVAMLERKGISVAAKPGEANAYEQTTGTILDTLQGLIRTFAATLDDKQKAHHLEASKCASQLQALSHLIDVNTEVKEEKEAASAAKTATMQETIGLRENEQESMNADKKFLDNLATECADKAKQFDSRSKSRAEEISKLSQAAEMIKQVMGGYEATGLAAASLVAVPVSRHQSTAKPSPVLLQLRRVPKKTEAQRKQADLVNLVGGKASKLQSASLVLVASALKEANDPDAFVKVRGLIKDLIEKLKAQGQAEDTRKSFCDTEMGIAIGDRDSNEKKIEENKRLVSELTSEIENLKKESAEEANKITEINKQKLEMNTLRTNEKASNEKTAADAAANAVVVRKAIGILEQFYATLQTSAGGKKQMKQDPITDRNGETITDKVAAPNFAAPVKQMDASAGIIGLLTVIATDLENLDKDTVANEAKAAAKFGTDIIELDANLKTATDTKETKDGDVAKKTTENNTAKEELANAERLHADALEALENLKASCVDGEETWEERKAKREQEIESLKQALEILENWKM